MSFSRPTNKLLEAYCCNHVSWAIRLLGVFNLFLNFLLTMSCIGTRDLSQPGSAVSSILGVRSMVGCHILLLVFSRLSCLQDSRCSSCGGSVLSFIVPCRRLYRFIKHFKQRFGCSILPFILQTRVSESPYMSKVLLTTSLILPRAYYVSRCLVRSQGADE